MQPARTAEAPPPSNPIAPTAAPNPAVGTIPAPTTAPVEAAPQPARAAPAFTTAAKILPAPTAPPVQVARAAVKPAAKPQAPTAHGGLWDMSNLDTPTQPKTAPSATNKPRMKAIYGDDPVE